MNKEEKIEIFLGAVVLFFILFMGIVFGYFRGYSKGMTTANEIQEKVGCEVDYSYKPLSEVPVKCLKYFNLNENGTPKN